MIGKYAINAHSEKTIGKITGEEGDYWLAIDSDNLQKRIPKNITIIQDSETLAVADHAGANENQVETVAAQVQGNSKATVLTKDGKEVKIAKGFSWPLLGIAILSLIDWLLAMLAYSIFSFIKKRFVAGAVTLAIFFVMGLVYVISLTTNETTARNFLAVNGILYAIMSFVDGFYWNNRITKKFKKEGWIEKH